MELLTHGTLFSVADDATTETLSSTNTKVTGSFTAGVTNYIGLDLIRSPDSSTADLVQFLDKDSGSEIAQIVPLARTLQYRIVISAQNFTVSSNILPIAKVVTTSTNTVTSVTDARKMMFRLGSGGDNPNAAASYAWGTRTENSITYSGGSDPFVGEDKSINNLKSWMDSIMTSIWEVKGGDYWYSAANRDNVKLGYGTPTLSDNNDNFYFSGTNLKWRSLTLLFENGAGGVYYNTITDNTGGTSFPDGSALYVDLVRSSNATIVAAIVSLASLGTSTLPGRRLILAWRKGSLVFTRDRAYEAGRQAPTATTTNLGLVELNATPASAGSPKVVAIQANGVASVTAVAASGATALVVTGDGFGSGGLATGGVDGFGWTCDGGSSSGYGALGRANADLSDGDASGFYGLGYLSAPGIIGAGGTGGAPGIVGVGHSVDWPTLKPGVGLQGKGYLGAQGVYGEGGSTAGALGVEGLGTETGYGVKGRGGSTDGSYGVYGTSTASNGGGVKGEATGTGTGVYGKGGNTGVIGEGGANATGMYGFASGNNGKGVFGEITSGDGDGVLGFHSSSGASGGSAVKGVVITSTGNTIAGVHGTGATPGAYGVIAEGKSASPTRSAFRIVPQANAPSVGQIGDLYIDTAGILYVCTNATGPAWTKVGTQT